MELANKYPVSEKTAITWIKEAKSGKLALDLYDGKGRARIASTNKKLTLIEQLVEARKKYRNNRAIFLTVTIEQLRDSQEYFDRRISSYKQWML